MPEISDFIRVTTRIATGGAIRRSFGTGLQLTAADAIPAGGSNKVQKFSNASQVTDVFGAGDALAAAVVWFSADPAPKNLYIGRWAEDDVATTLEGTAPGTVAQLAVANASFSIGGRDVTVDLSGQATYADIASEVQTALRALAGAPINDNRFGGASFAVVGGVFLLTLAGADDVGLLGAHSAGTGTDVSGLLGMNEAADPDYKPGHDAETVEEAIAEMVNLAVDMPTYLYRDDSTPDTFGAANTDTDLALAAYTEANEFMCGIRDTTAQALVTGDVTSKLASLFASQYSQTVPVYSEAGKSPHISAVAALSGINFDGVRAIITLHGKPMPGSQPSAISGTQLAELARKRANAYTSIGGVPTFVEGFTARAGYWADASAWLLWAKSSIEVAVWDALRGSRRLTVGIMYDTLSKVMEQGVRNGGIQPGRNLSAEGKADVAATTGNADFNGVLTTGYLIHIGRIADQTQSEIDSRESPPVKIWAIGSEAIHRANIDLVFQN